MDEVVAENARLRAALKRIAVVTAEVADDCAGHSTGHVWAKSFRIISDGAYAALAASVQP